MGFKNLPYRSIISRLICFSFYIFHFFNFSENYANSKLGLLSEIPRIGDWVAVELDSLWFRARVLSAPGTNRRCTVELVDYGRSKAVSVSRMRTLCAKYFDLPRQAVEAGVAFLQPVEVSCGFSIFLLCQTEHRPVSYVYIQAHYTQLCKKTRNLESKGGVFVYLDQAANRGPNTMRHATA